MSKKKQATKSEKQASKSSMTELVDDQLDAVQGGVVSSPPPSVGLSFKSRSFGPRPGPTGDPGAVSGASSDQASSDEEFRLQDNLFTS